MAFSDLLHHTLLSVSINNDRDEVRFLLDDGQVFRMFHSQDCCESVSLEDVCGDLDDLRMGYVLEAREEVGEAPDGKNDEGTWTFYIIQTDKGAVTLRWYGISNGYYSESVDFVQDEPCPEEAAQIRAAQLEQATVSAQRASSARHRL